MTVLTHIDHQDTRPTAIIHRKFRYGFSNGSVLSLFFVLFVFFAIMVVVIVIITPLLPSSFISAPSSAAVK